MVGTTTRPSFDTAASGRDVIGYVSGYSKPMQAALAGITPRNDQGPNSDAARAAKADQAAKDKALFDQGVGASSNPDSKTNFILGNTAAQARAGLAQTAQQKRDREAMDLAISSSRRALQDRLDQLNREYEALVQQRTEIESRMYKNEKGQIDWARYGRENGVEKKENETDEAYELRVQRELEQKHKEGAVFSGPLGEWYANKDKIETNHRQRIETQARMEGASPEEAKRIATERSATAEGRQDLTRVIATSSNQATKVAAADAVVNNEDASVRAVSRDVAHQSIENFQAMKTADASEIDAATLFPKAPNVGQAFASVSNPSSPAPQFVNEQLLIQNPPVAASSPRTGNG